MVDYEKEIFSEDISLSYIEVKKIVQKYLIDKYSILPSPNDESGVTIEEMDGKLFIFYFELPQDKEKLKSHPKVIIHPGNQDYYGRFLKTGIRPDTDNEEKILFTVETVISKVAYLDDPSVKKDIYGYIETKVLMEAHTRYEDGREPVHVRIISRNKGRNFWWKSLAENIKRESERLFSGFYSGGETANPSDVLSTSQKKSSPISSSETIPEENFIEKEPLLKESINNIRLPKFAGQQSKWKRVWLFLQKQRTLGRSFTDISKMMEKDLLLKKLPHDPDVLSKIEKAGLGGLLDK